MRQEMATDHAVGAGMFHSYYLVLLAEAYGKTGQTEDGLGTLTEALTVVDKNGERFYEAELYRIKGELTLQEARQKSKGKSQKSKSTPRPLTPDPQAEAETEACFFKAIEIARSSGRNRWNCMR